jgi:hypothetical protein
MESLVEGLEAVLQKVELEYLTAGLTGDAPAVVLRDQKGILTVL